MRDDAANVYTGGVDPAAGLLVWPQNAFTGLGGAVLTRSVMLLINKSFHRESGKHLSRQQARAKAVAGTQSGSSKL